MKLKTTPEDPLTSAGGIPDVETLQKIVRLLYLADQGIYGELDEEDKPINLTVNRFLGILKMVDVRCVFIKPYPANGEENYYIDVDHFIPKITSTIKTEEGNSLLFKTAKDAAQFLQDCHYSCAVVERKA